MKKRLYIIALCALVLAGCGRPSKVEQYRAEKRATDSVRLEEQVRSLAYYEAQLERLMPIADSLLTLFSYEKNDKYQDHGYYVTNSDLRILVRDDGKELLVYKEGKRLTAEGVKDLKNERVTEALARAEELQVTISDIKELEKRIQRTSLEVQKYQKRLQKQ